VIKFGICCFASYGGLRKPLVVYTHPLSQRAGEVGGGNKFERDLLSCSVVQERVLQHQQILRF
jgi:hypothetical protein